LHISFYFFQILAGFSQVEETNHGFKGVIDFVGNGCSKAADRGQLLALDKGLFGSLLRGYTGFVSTLKSCPCCRADSSRSKCRRLPGEENYSALRIDGLDLHAEVDSTQLRHHHIRMRKSGQFLSADLRASSGSVKATASKPERFKIVARLSAITFSSSTT